MKSRDAKGIFQTLSILLILLNATAYAMGTRGYNEAHYYAPEGSKLHGDSGVLPIYVSINRDLKISIAAPVRKLKGEKATDYFEGEISILGVQVNAPYTLIIDEMEFIDEESGKKYPVRLRRYHFEEVTVGNMKVMRLTYDDQDFVELKDKLTLEMAQGKSILYRFNVSGVEKKKLLLKYKLSIKTQNGNIFESQHSQTLHFTKWKATWPFDYLP